MRIPETEAGLHAMAGAGISRWAGCSIRDIYEAQPELEGLCDPWDIEVLGEQVEDIIVNWLKGVQNEV